MFLQVNAAILLERYAFFSPIIPVVPPSWELNLPWLFTTRGKAGSVLSDVEHCLPYHAGTLWPPGELWLAARR